MSEICVERLFLAKEQKSEIYVDNAEFLTKDQINAIRFLYVKFRKYMDAKSKTNGISGVILNKCGASVLKSIICFLHAIQMLLQKPVLVICTDENDFKNWLNLFQEVVDMDDVIFRPKRMCANKKYFVIMLEDIALFSIQNWSIIIIEDSAFQKEIFKMNLKATYKIWTTHVNLKKDLQNLSKVYSWMYPEKEKFDIQKFIDSDNIHDKINKGILLDTFLEDMVYSSNSASNNSEEESLDIKIVLEAPKRKKFKDITGKKVKRSKRQLNDDDLPEITANQTQNHLDSFQDRVIEEKNTLSKLEELEQQANYDSMDTQNKSFEAALLDMLGDQDSVAPCNKNGVLNQEVNEESCDSDLSNLLKDDNNMKNSFELPNNTNTALAILESAIENKEIKNTVNPMNIKSRSLDSKLKDLEKRTLEKYKGSLLDDLF